MERMSDYFFFNDTATTEIYTLSLHDALPICRKVPGRAVATAGAEVTAGQGFLFGRRRERWSSSPPPLGRIDRKSTRLNSSHANISYAVFCLKKKKLTACSYSPLALVQSPAVF